MLHRLLRADPATQAAAWYFIETAIIASSTQAPAHASTMINPTAPHSSILTSLVEWGNENSMELWKGGYLSGHSNQNQSLVIILDSLSDPLKRRLAATGCTSLADAREFINGEWKWKDPHPIIPPEQMQELVATVTNPSDSRPTLRVGQCWLIPPRIAEITGCSSDQVAIQWWKPRTELKVFQGVKKDDPSTTSTEELIDQLTTPTRVFLSDQDDRHRQIIGMQPWQTPWARHPSKPRHCCCRC